MNAGPEPPLSCDMRLNHAVNSCQGRTQREGPQSVCRRPRRGHSEVHGAAGEGHSEAFALSPGTSASCAGGHRGKPRVCAQLLAVSPMTIRSWERVRITPTRSHGAFSTKSKWHRATSGDAFSPPRLTRNGQTGRDQPASTGKTINAKVNEGLGTYWLRMRGRTLPRKTQLNVSNLL